MGETSDRTHSDTRRSNNRITYDNRMYGMSSRSGSGVSAGVSGVTVRPEYLFLNHVLSDTGSQRLAGPTVGVTSLTFDQEEELLWMGNEAGHVTSYYGLSMSKYTSFHVHSDSDIRSQLSGPFGLLSLTKNSLRLSIRRGLTVFEHTSHHLKDMYCMARTEAPARILMSGQQDELIDFDLETVRPVRVTRLSDPGVHEEDGCPESGCMIIRNHPQYACCGDASGKITLRDKKSLSAQHSFTTHSGQLSDFDVRGNYLITCGYSSRDGNYHPDRFLMVYDLRMLKAVTPIAMTYAPFLLRFVPVYASTFCVVSQAGQFELLDTSTSLTTAFPHTMDIPPGAAISAFDVSTSSQALSFADSAGYVYLFGASPDILFNPNSRATEFPHQVQRFAPLAVDDYSTPFSLIPPQVVPPIDEKDRDDFLSSLSSNLPPDVCRKVFRRPKPIDSEILSSMKMTGSVGYAPNPRGRRRGWQSLYEPEDELPVGETTLESYFASMCNGSDDDPQTQTEAAGNELGVGDCQSLGQELSLESKTVRTMDILTNVTTASST